MAAGELIVLERDGHWAAALRRELADRARLFARDERYALLPLPLGEGRGEGAPPVAHGPHPHLLPKGEETVRLIEVRSWEECSQRLAGCPTALVAAELTEANVGQILDALGRWDREFPQAALIVLAERRMAPYRDLIREAGALHFITSPRRLGEVAEIVRRRSAKPQATAGAMSPTDEILAELPWPVIGVRDSGLGTRMPEEPPTAAG